MAGIVAGAGLGLERSSGWVLGSGGRLGDPTLGRAAEDVFVNAANGNLMVNQQDEFLIGLGPDSAIGRTYNSQAALNGPFSDDNADKWRMSVSRRLLWTNGTEGASGSTVTLVDWDGSVTVLSYDGSAYVDLGTAGADDRLTWAGNAWRWRDGLTGVEDVFYGVEANPDLTGRLKTRQDADNKRLEFSYVGTLVSRVSTDTGESTELVYDVQSRLQRLVTTYTDETGQTRTRTRTRYGYDAEGRLATVTVDLTPGDNAVTDGAAYVTSYTYEGTTRRLTSIIQTDGSQLLIDYTNFNGERRVTSLRQVVGGVERLTTYSYDIGARRTTITDPFGAQTVLAYTAEGRIASYTPPPAVGGGPLLTTVYAYTPSGRLQSIDRPGEGLTRFEYDPRGNLTIERDALGNTVARTYSAMDQLLTETRYLVPDPDGAGAGQPSTPLTTRFAYDAEQHLRFEISDEGRVTEHRYDVPGRRTMTRAFSGATYATAGLGVGSSPDLSALEAWVSGLADKSLTLRTDYAYDFRGGLTSVATYGAISANGNGNLLRKVETTYVYDAFGRLLSRHAVTADSTETRVYDGLDRVLAFTDYNGALTQTAYTDAQNKTAVTFANGRVHTSTFNGAGERVSFAESMGGGAALTTSYAYDLLGRLRSSTAPGGAKTFHLYDAAGRKSADIDSTGALTEHRYDAAGRLALTIRYGTALTAAELAELQAEAFSAQATVAAYRPAAGTADRWSWRIHDAAGRLLQIIAADGAVIDYAYDGASRLVRVTGRANRLSAPALSGLRNTPPTAPVTASGSSDDRVTRQFYDDDGLLAGTLDAEGYLVQFVRDGAGQPVRTIRYAGAVHPTLRAASGLAALIADVETDLPDRIIREHFYYDQMGRLLSEVDGEGNVTGYFYSNNGFLQSKTTGKKLDPQLFATAPPDWPTIQSAPFESVIEFTDYTHDADGKRLSERRVLEGDQTEFTLYAYDVMGQLTRVTSASGSTDERVTVIRYDGEGRVIGELTGIGAVALDALGPNPTSTDVTNVYRSYGAAIYYDGDGRMRIRTSPSGHGGSPNGTFFYYDGSDQLRFEITTDGLATEHQYDAFGERVRTIVYGRRISTAGLVGGAITAALTAAVTAVTDASIDAQTQLSYDVTGALSRVLDALNAETTYAYNAFGERTTELAPYSGAEKAETTRRYDHRGLLTSIDTPIWGTTVATTNYQYDGFGRLTQTTRPHGHTNAVEYDRADRVTATIDAFAQRTTNTYDARGNLTKVVDRTGAETAYAYIEFGRRITTTHPGGAITVATFNAAGQTLTLRDAEDRLTTFNYDKDGQLTSTIDAVSTVGGEYDRAGRLWKSTDARGVVTVYAYDGVDRVLSRTIDPTGLNLITRYDYSEPLTVIVTDPALTKTRQVYDRLGRLVEQVVDPEDGTGAPNLALRTTWAYDEAHTLTVTEGAGTSAERVTVHTFEESGRLTKSVIDPSGVAVTRQYAYDRNGNLVQDITPVSDNWVFLRFAYDAEGRRTHAIDDVGAVTRYDYDAEGRVVTARRYADILTDAELAVLPANMNSLAATLPIVESAADQVTRSVHDGDGRLRFVVDPLGRPTEYVYDDSGLLLRTIEYADGVTLTAPPSLAAMDGLVAPLRASLANRLTRFTYDAAGRLSFTIDAEGYVNYFFRDEAGLTLAEVRYGETISDVVDHTHQEIVVIQSQLQGDMDRYNWALYDKAGRTIFSVDNAGFATEFIYDARGNVTRQIRRLTAIDLSAGVNEPILRARFPAIVAGDAVTDFTYDAAGRLTARTALDVSGADIRTRYVLDARGRATETIVADGATGDVVTTGRAYDDADRMTSETRGGSTTGFTYDGAGRLKQVTDPRLGTVQRTYDGAGNVLTVKTLLADDVYATVTNSYDAFGNLVKTIDPRLGEGFFYYDRLNRLTWQVDPERFVTRTEYGAGGEPTAVTRFDAPLLSAPQVGTPPSLVATPVDAVTRFGRDKLDRLTSVTDAENHGESYTLSAFGDRLIVKNRLNGETINTFDRRGLLISETLPIAAFDASGAVLATQVVNTFAYDARGNRTQWVEASNIAADRRVTDYEYDKADRLKRVLHPQVAVDGGGLVRPQETFVHDRRGNLIEHKDIAGARTLSYYNGRDEKIAEVDALGRLRRWTRDANGNVAAETTYDNPVALAATPGGAEPAAPAGGSRTTSFTYDRNNRLTFTTMAAVRIGEVRNDVYWQGDQNLVTQHAYDASGNLVWSKDARGGERFFHYDKLGRLTLSVDAERYITAYTRDADGNVNREERYATRLPDTVTLITATRPTPTDLANSGGGDRVTTFTYDRNGRRTEERRLSATVATVDANGVLTESLTDVVIRFQYNGLGQVTRRTEATGEFIDYGYDTGGRLTSEVSSPLVLSGFTGEGTTHQRRTLHSYDGVGNLVRTSSDRVEDGSLRITRFTYGEGGRLAEMVDATGFKRTYAHDLGGRLVREDYAREKSDETALPVLVLEGVGYSYDVLGRVVQQSAVARPNSTSAWAITGDRSQVRYNLHGEVTAKGVNDGWQESFEYDKGGRVWRTTAGDGVTRIRLYDGAGALTLEAHAVGTLDLSALGQVQDAISLLTAGGTQAIGAFEPANLVVTLEVLDKRGQSKETREPFRDIILAGQSNVGNHTLVRSRTYNAFGEALSETDARGAITEFAYDTRGKLMTRTSPEVQAVSESGVASNLRPVERYHHDAAGRLAGQRTAANAAGPAGAMTTWRYLAGSGRDGAEAVVLMERHADGGIKRYGVNIHGDVVKEADELGYVRTREHDELGRMIRLNGPAQTALGGYQLVEEFKYDGLGQLIRRSNSHQTGVARTDYDAQGRIVRTQEIGVADADATTHNYKYKTAIDTIGLRDSHGWSTETLVSGRRIYEEKDYFGRETFRSDNGLHTTFEYDKGGRMSRSYNAEYNTDYDPDRFLVYTWYDTSQLAKVEDQGGPPGDRFLRSEYAYDAAGNRVRENQIRRVGAAEVVQQDADASYDHLNRLTSVSDVGELDFTVNYSYDPNGNVRRTTATYQTLDGGSDSQDYWYRYDVMDRMVTARGDLRGGQIVRNAPGPGDTTMAGVDLSYDLAGRRRTVTTDFLDSKPAGVGEPGGEEEPWVSEEPPRGGRLQPHDLSVNDVPPPAVAYKATRIEDYR